MRGAGTRRPWRPVTALAVALALGLPLGAALAAGPFNEREAKPMAHVEDKEGIWVLDFRFKDPRLITVDVPGRGRRLCWYLWYQVINNPPPDGKGSAEPVTFIPEFELVTLDKPGVYHDQVLPTVQDAIQKLEDPAGFEEKQKGRAPYLDLKNSVTIASRPIPPSKARDEAFPRAVTGVAIWEGVDPEAGQFSIFVTGLSNGWTVAKRQTDGKEVVRRKTLQLNFKRVGSRYAQESKDIRFVPPVQWIYRASKVTLPEVKKEKDEPKEGAARAPARPALVPQPGKQ